MKKCMFAALALVTLAMVFTGCSKKDAAPAAGEAKVEAAGQIVKYWYPWGGDSEIWDKKRMAGFEKATGFTIESTYVPEGAGVRNGKLMAAINSGDVPDIVVSDAPTQAYGLATQGAFEPLDAVLKEINFDPSRVSPGLLPYMKWHGVTYVFPQNTDVTLLFYRTDLFEEAGLDVNKPPKSIAELDEYAQKLTKMAPNGKDVERYGFIPWLDAGADPSTWTFQFGADPYDEANDKVTIATPEMVKVYQWQRDYAQKADPERMRAFTSSLGAAFSPDHAFMQGKVAMTVIGNWFCNAIKIHAPGLKYEVTPVPTLNSDIYGSCALAGNIFFVPKGAKNILGGIKYADFCQSAEWVEDNNRDWRSLGLYKDSIEGLSLYKAKDPALMKCIDVTFNPNSHVWALSPVTPQLDDDLRQFTDYAIYEKGDLMSKLQEFQTQLQAQVDEDLKNNS